MRNRFERELGRLFDELIEMGCLIEGAIEDAVDALNRRDTGLARQTIAADREVDEKERQIERHCLQLLLQQQPVAADLRLISTALKMVTDMERIGDHAADIGELTLLLAARQHQGARGHIPQMAKATIGMVKGAIDAFVGRDLALAQSVIDSDDVVDGLFDAQKQELILKIAAGEGDAEQLVDLLLVAKYFERIGDHAVNVAQWVIFSITGKHKEARIV